MEQQSDTVSELKKENKALLEELAATYKNMETVLVQSASEKEIAYQELDNKYKILTQTYQELSKKENMLVHLDKLSSIGQFITEIVHELRNPLTVISGIIELVMLQEVPDNIRERLDKIPEQLERMNSNLERFKAMAYKSREDFQYFNLNENLSDFLETIEIIRPKNIKILRDLDFRNMSIHGDPYQITQIYLNLAKNAFDAMSSAGSSLEVKSKYMTRTDVQSKTILGSIACQDEKIWQKIVEEYQEYGMVEFKDNGSGIAEDLKKNIFSAFFTTKERGKGTGLGLSISSDIAKRHNANIAVKSELGVGTIIQLLIPLSRANQSVDQRRN